ncbi:hypothetical protein TNCV_4273001 [Trichonephila clavipes]|nr:hypothetical protein TNCV_4273001 [Trichonephila clavipes]
MTTKRMAPQTITHCHEPVGNAIVRVGSLRCPRRLQTRLWLSLRHGWKQDSSLNATHPQSMQFHFDRAGTSAIESDGA